MVGFEGMSAERSHITDTMSLLTTVSYWKPNVLSFTSQRRAIIARITDESLSLRWEISIHGFITHMNEVVKQFAQQNYFEKYTSNQRLSVRSLAR